ncbi:MAG: chromosome segregation protein SMC [Nanoarchaeota archaeon]
MTLTKINRIEMKGFKSFANKTEILFGDEFNCVLGPNGSGKSNILDALCFVLGKSSAKGLRAEKSANLIYNGGKLKNPAKEGIVTIVFDNSKKVFREDTPEVKIARIIHENGNSTYKINDKTRTRQQVLDLMSMVRINPDGHNIILQGDIVYLIEMSLNERRQIVEEISGISVYEDKKNKALKELQRVEEKMNEAEIILTERKTYLRELKSERDQAQKFKDLDDKIKRNKATILDSKITKKKDELKKYDRQKTEYTTKVKVIEDEIIQLRKEIEDKKAKIEKINQEVERKGEKEQVALHKEVEAIKVDFGIKKQRLETLGQEILKLEERKKELEKNQKELLLKIENLQKTKEDCQKRIGLREEDIRKIDRKLQEFKKKNQLSDAQEIDKKVEEIDKEAEQIQEQISKIREQQQNLLREKDRLELRLQSIDEQILKVVSVEKENKKAIEDLKQKKVEFKKATMELSQALTENSSFSAQLENARSTILSRKEELGKISARHSAIRENVAGGLAVQRILELAKKEKGIHGTVSDVGTVSSKYALALEVAAGPRIKSIIVENDAIAAKCINYLKQNRLGVATFLPLNKLNPPRIDESARQAKGEGIHGMALDLVNFKPLYRKVFEYVFTNTIIVDDVETARRVGIGRLRMATLTGDLVEQSGAMQGGYRTREKGALGFQEKELNDELEKLEKEIADSEKVIANLEKKRIESQNTIDNLREFKANLEAEIIKQEKMLHLESGDLEVTKTEKGKIGGELKEAEKKIDVLNADILAKNKRLSGIKIEKQSMREKLNELRNPQLLAELNTFEEKKKELLEEISGIRGEMKNADSEMTNVLNPEKESVIKILRQHEKEKAGFESEKKELEAFLKKQQLALIEKEKSEKAFYAQFKELFTKRSALSNEVTKLENQISNKTDTIRQLEQKNNASSLETARLKAELAGMDEEFKQYEGVPLFKGKSEEEILKEIGQFEKMFQDIGAVNMKALEIYDKVEREYKNLLEKKESLMNEREDVLVMINEIDSKKKELFMRTFEILTKNFQTIFKTLSTKGEAYLELEDSNDPFNGGLDIKVRLAGKKFMDIRSLSGGEKTLTALAFLFAIQEHEPASFYILDEVDAALDKRNSEKLSELIKSYAHKAQYIMISHNDSVISSADTLYGVSMNEHGISKITSLKI